MEQKADAPLCSASRLPAASCRSGTFFAYHMTNRGLTLTREGRVYITHIRQILHLEEFLKSYFDDLNNLKTVKGAGTSADCFWGCHLDHCFNDEMKPIPTNLKNTGENRNESFA